MGRDDEIICTREVNENIRRCQLGQPLTRSLWRLNCNCEFKEKFEEMDKITHREEIELEKRLNSQRIYLMRKKDCNEKGLCIACGHKKDPSKFKSCDKCRENFRRYYKRPEVKKRRKESVQKYNQKPEVKKRRKEYYRKLYKNNREEILKKQKERYRKNKLKNIKKEVNK